MDLGYEFVCIFLFRWRTHSYFPYYYYDYDYNRIYRVISSHSEIEEREREEKLSSRIETKSYESE